MVQKKHIYERIKLISILILQLPSPLVAEAREVSQQTLIHMMIYERHLWTDLVGNRMIISIYCLNFKRTMILIVD